MPQRMDTSSQRVAAAFHACSSRTDSDRPPPGASSSSNASVRALEFDRGARFHSNGALDDAGTEWWTTGLERSSASSSASRTPRCASALGCGYADFRSFRRTAG